ncbi:MAG: hypothetical protein EOP89_05235 [Lysobacteraceae bacterium]|nr:MAG: hypothetical protein EOP89_05235 [Xanthomonadaceae bacterium]
MKIVNKIAAVVALVGIAAPAAAGPVIQPVPVGTETIRYFQGVPTLDLQRDHGAVQITPLPMDHGSYAFTVAVLNKGPSSANIDVTNVDVESGGIRYTVLSRSDLEHKAKNRAMWGSIALAAAGGLAAAAAASATDTYRATTYTPHGTYRTIIQTPSTGGQLVAAGAIAGTGAGIYAIQNQLDQTREALGATTVQMTTVDPQDSYAGRIVLSKIKTTALPQRINIVVRWNGESYPFGFQLSKKGTPQPVFDVLTPAPVVPNAADDHPAAMPALSAPSSPVTGA